MIRRESAYSAEYFFWLAAEVALSLLIISLLLASVPKMYDLYSTRAGLTQLFWEIGLIRADVQLEYAHTGHWPEAYANLYDRHRSMPHGLRFDPGAVTFLFDDSIPQITGMKLSFVLNHIPGRASDRLVWSCGYNNPPSQFKALGINHTNVPPEYLPHTCRKGATK